MSDIVERLRTRPTGDPYLHMMVHDAADEIERLRAEAAGLREFVEHVRRNGSTHLASMAIAVLAARKGTTLTTPPPSPSPRS